MGGSSSNCSSTDYDIQLTSEEYRAICGSTDDWLRVHGVNPDSCSENQYRIAELKALNETLRSTSAELAERELFLEALFDQAPVGYLVVDEDGLIEKVNERATTLVQRSPGSLAGSSSSMLFAPEDRQAFSSARIESTRGEHAQVFEARLSAGEQPLVSVSVSYLQQASENRWLVALTDLTSQRQAEAQAERAHKLVKETHHRVKNNFQFISSLLELNRPAGAGDAANKVIDESQARLAALSTLHEAIHRQERGNDLDLGAYLDDVVRALNNVYTVNSRVHIHARLERGIVVDSRRAVSCGVAITEIVANAVEHAFEPSEGGDISICLARDHAGTAVVSVEDSGPGLADHDGFDLSSSHGLGLVAYLVRDSLGSELERCSEACSDLGGACFTFRFEIP